MEKEIEEIIKKNLPQQVGETLKKALQKAEEDAQELERTKRNYKDLETLNGTLSNKLQEYKQHDERNSKLDVREKAIEDRERKQDVWEANLKVIEMEKRITDNTNFVGMVFKSPIFRKNVSESVSGSSYWDNATNRNVFVPDGGSKNKTETHEKD